MRKKLIGVTLVMLAALAAAVLYFRAPETARLQPAAPVVVATPVTAPAAVTEAPAPAQADSALNHAETEEAPEDGEITQTLKGRDFTLQVAVNGNERYRDVSITMDDGVPLNALHTLQGTSAELSNLTFAPGDTFELSTLIPGQPREQIVCKGSAYLMGGEGMLETFTMYRIDDGKLHELINVITARDREEGNGPPAQKLEATVTQTTQDGKPAIVYRVTADGAPERTITFLWDGRQFIDASGEYAKIGEQYHP